MTHKQPLLSLKKSLLNDLKPYFKRLYGKGIITKLFVKILRIMTVMSTKALKGSLCIYYKTVMVSIMQRKAFI